MPCLSSPNSRCKIYFREGIFRFTRDTTNEKGSKNRRGGKKGEGIDDRKTKKRRRRREKGMLLDETLTKRPPGLARPKQEGRETTASFTAKARDNDISCCRMIILMPYLFQQCHVLFSYVISCSAAA